MNTHVQLRVMLKGITLIQTDYRFERVENASTENNAIALPLCLACQTWGPRSGVDEDSSLRGCHAAKTGKGTDVSEQRSSFILKATPILNLNLTTWALCYQPLDKAWRRTILANSETCLHCMMRTIWQKSYLYEAHIKKSVKSPSAEFSKQFVLYYEGLPRTVSSYQRNVKSKVCQRLATTITYITDVMESFVWSYQSLRWRKNSWSFTPPVGPWQCSQDSGTGQCLATPSQPIFKLRSTISLPPVILPIIYKLLFFITTVNTYWKGPLYRIRFLVLQTWSASLV